MTAELEALRGRVLELEHTLAATEQKAPALREELDQLHAAFESAPVGMALVTADGRFLRANQALADMVGRTLAELTELRFRDLTHPDDRDIDTAHMRRMLAGEVQTLQREKRYLHADGHVVWLLLSATLVRDKNGAPAFFWSQFQNITERKQTEVALYESEQRFLQFMEALPVSILVLDKSGQPFYANQAAQALLGQGIKPQAPIEQLAQVYRACVAGTDEPYPMERMPIVRALSGERSSVDDMEIHQAGRVVPLEVTAAPIVDSGGAVAYAIGVFADITERRRAEDALRQSIAQEQIIRAQEASLQELSTPLIPINDQVLAMPLIGAVDSRRAQQVIESLLHGVAEQRATTVILDITGVSVVDTQVANGLIRAAQAVQLLGAQVVLTGIRPEVAQTLVGLGVDLRAIVTRATLQSGISYAMGQH
jgi:rsbT co-antagonist protein RsbR